MEETHEFSKQRSCTPFSWEVIRVKKIIHGVFFVPFEREIANDTILPWVASFFDRTKWRRTEVPAKARLNLGAGIGAFKATQLYFVCEPVIDDGRDVQDGFVIRRSNSVWKVRKVTKSEAVANAVR